MVAGQNPSAGKPGGLLEEDVEVNIRRGLPRPVSSVFLLPNPSQCARVTIPEGGWGEGSQVTERRKREKDGAGWLHAAQASGEESS